MTKNKTSDGLNIIKDFVKKLPETSGVYRMFNKNDKALYIGKAKNLPKRVINYTHTDKLPYRLQRMVFETAYMEFTTTETEAEALLLEANLIKKFKPHYNILLRDDKSFPYILITKQHDYPLLTKHRGARNKEGEFFGPFASAGAVNQTISILQRVFMLRNCSDNVFKNRTRPCLQYQIKRCTAPCVHYVSKNKYAKQVEMARKFLKGQSRNIQQELTKEMLHASKEQEFEHAAAIRDRIQALTAIQTHPSSQLSNLGDVDVISLFYKSLICCIQVFFYRSGQNFGNRAFFPKCGKDDTENDILSAFLGQFYLNKPTPPQIFINVELENITLFEEALTQEANRYKTTISIPKQGAKKQIMDMALSNAVEAYNQHIASKASHKKNLKDLKETFNLPEAPNRIEIYDNSHISGTYAIGAMVVFTPEGFVKTAYRTFNIKSNIAAGDDFAMMREVFTRRFANYHEKNSDIDAQYPDMILVDGGAGQVSATESILTALGISDIPLIGIAKGPDRNAGKERFFLPNQKEPIKLEMNSPLLHFLQRLRDESHRFAIGTHRKKRNKAFTKSPLDQISGIGAKRKKALLLHFGSAKAIEVASLHELEKIDGISKAIAKKLYNAFHE